MPVHMSELLSPRSGDKILELATVSREVNLGNDISNSHVGVGRVG